MNPFIGTSTKSAQRAMSQVRQKPAFKAAAGPIEKRIDSVDPHTIPADLIEQLPALLRDGAAKFESVYERDVFLTASLGVLSNCIQNVVGLHGDGNTALNLNVCICAPAGSGKGSMRYARRLGEVIDNRLHQESLSVIQNISESGDAEKTSSTVPPIRSLFLGGNSSERALLESIHANDGRGVLFETEIVTLSKIFGAVGGDASDLILKAFHQEPVTISRKGYRIYIPRPSFSVVVSGTPESLKTIINRIEVGLFSRFAFYSFQAPPEWKSHRPAKRSNDRDEFFDRAGDVINTLYRKLENRTKLLVVRLTGKQWDKIDNAFQTELELLHDLGMDRSLEASVKRAATIAFRITCILAVLRAYENRRRLQIIDNLIATDADARIGIGLALLYLQHAYRVAVRLQYQTPKDQRRADFLTALPPGEFTTGEAVQIGETMSPTIPTRTIMRYLDGFATEGLIRRKKHGVYLKPKHAAS